MDVYVDSGVGGELASIICQVKDFSQALPYVATSIL